MKLNKLLFAAALAGAGYLALLPPVQTSAPQAEFRAEAPSLQPANADAALEHAYLKRLRHHQVRGQGTVIKLLPDDNKGSRHQRFLLRLGSGRTLLISHNIDLASRIDALQTGDTVAFNGEYEWNAQGGLVHWTHHDPQNRHEFGWLRHLGRTYQ